MGRHKRIHSMVQSTEISLQLFASGYCEAHASIVNPLTGKGKARFYAVWALLFIPQKGYVLFDTGYSSEFRKVTSSFPERLYRWVTPVFLKETETAKYTLSQKGISADDINYVIISHFHADHIAALKDFTRATFICSQKALQEVQILRGIRAVRKGILHGLLPNDFYSRVKTIEDMGVESSASKEGLVVYDIFQTKHFKLVAIPGHAKGMLGFIVDYQHRHIFYGSDASWDYDSFKQNILPRKIVNLFFDSWSDFVETLQKIKLFERNNPQFTILFTHCPKTLTYIRNEI